MIPYATTTIDIFRPHRTDAYDEPVPRLVASGVRAVISEPGGTRQTDYIGTSSATRRRLTCDPSDLRPGDLVSDGSTMWTVEYTSAVRGPLAHITAGIAVEER